MMCKSQVCLFRVAAFLAAVVLLCVPARAQFGFGDGDWSQFMAPITKKAVDTYASMVGMDKEQKEAALALQEGYRGEFKQLQADIKKMTKDMMEKMQDEGMAAYGKDAVKVGQQMTERFEKLEKGFLDDMKSLLNDQQKEKWVRVERMRRRDNTMRMSFMSGSNVDLFKILSTVGVKMDASPEIARELERYETELDAKLKAFETWGKEQQAKQAKAMEEGNAEMFDMGKIQAMMKEMANMAKDMRDTNRQFARSIQPHLPADKQAKFDLEIKKKSFPRVYKDGYAAKALAEAMKFADLDANQKESLASLRSGYERELESVNKAWAAAIEDREEKNGGKMGAMMATFSGGGDSNDDLSKAKKARKELDERTAEKLMSYLNEDQKKRLPEDKPDPNDKPGMDWFDIEPPEQDDE